MEDKKYKVSAKRTDTGKWWTFGSVKKNTYGNLTLGLKVSEDLKNLIRAKKDGEYVNFSLFEDDEGKDSNHNKAKRDGYAPQNDDLY